MLIGNKTDLNALQVVPAEDPAAFASAFMTCHFLVKSAAESLRLATMVYAAENGIYRMESSKQTEPSSSSPGRPLKMIETLR
ncbi:hypothetical protein BC826DRAFT_1057915 [Russula brevipes]|nr:hypothetical protein BC826DRAFT_1057915 [Russula brevipes]